MYKGEKEQAEAIEEHGEDLKEGVQGAWRHVKARLKNLWAPLTDEDLDRNEGQRDLLVSAIQEKTGQARDDVARKLDEISEEVGYPLK